MEKNISLGRRYLSGKQLGASKHTTHSFQCGEHSLQSGIRRQIKLSSVRGVHAFIYFVRRRMIRKFIFRANKCKFVRNHQIRPAVERGAHAKYFYAFLCYIAIRIMCLLVALHVVLLDQPRIKQTEKISKIALLEG